MNYGNGVGPVGCLVLLCVLGLGSAEFFLFWVSIAKAVFVTLGLIVVTTFAWAFWALRSSPGLDRPTEEP